jgi:glycosyltransferase involved in cell wall biosynthesis
MKIAIYAIAKNEEWHVARFLESAKDADYIVVFDTGSTDRTVALLRDHNPEKVIVHEGAVRPWRFDVARNTALALVPADADACLCLDLDETMEPGWRQAIERAWTPEHIRLSYPFVFAHNPDGSPAGSFSRDLCHSRWGFQWDAPVHEALVNRGAVGRWTRANDLVCHHYPDVEKSRGQYIDILTAAVAERPHDPRMKFYCAREHWYRGETEQAVALFTLYLNQSTYAAERGEAMRILATLQPELAETWLQKAIAEDAGRRDQWVDLGFLHYRNGRWAAGLGAIQRALEITDRFAGFMTFGSAWGARPHHIAACCACELGLRELAEAHVLLALEHDPESENLLRLRDQLQEAPLCA